MTAPASIAQIQADLAKSLPRWGLSPHSDVTLLGHSENTTFLARDPDSGRELVLRVHRMGYHTPDEICSELSWIEALIESRAVETPRPVRDRDATLLCALPLAGTMRHVVAFTRMSGREPDQSASLPAWFHRLGAITAKLHKHAIAWRRPEGFQRKVWDFDAMLGTRQLWGDWRAAAGLQRDEKALLEKVAASLADRLQRYGDGRERHGLVHADLRLANLLVDGDRLGVIDFDDCGFSWFFYDFAAAVSFIEHSPILPDLQAAWLEGYRAVAPVARADEEMLATFVMLRRLLLTAWVASHSETETARAAGQDYAHITAEMGERFLRRAL